MEKMVQIKGGGITLYRPLRPDDVVIIKNHPIKVDGQGIDGLFRICTGIVEYKLLFTKGDTASLFWTGSLVGELASAGDKIRRYEEMKRTIPTDCIGSVIEDVSNAEWCKSFFVKGRDFSNLFHVDLIEVE